MIKFRKLFLVILISVTSFLLLSALLPSKPTAMGALSGRLINARWGIVAGQEITIRNSSYQRTVFSDERGVFQVPRIPVGIYWVSLGTGGSIQPFTQEVIVHLGREARITLALNADNLEEVNSNIVQTPRFILDDQGRVRAQETWIEDRVYYVEYSYGTDGKLVSITDNMNQGWEYEYTDSGKIGRIKRKNRGSIDFYYDENDQLGNIYLPWGYNIYYAKKGNNYTKTVTKYKNQKIIELSYTLDEHGRKTTVEEGAGRLQRFGYEYDDNNRLAEIRDLNTGKTNSSIASRLEHMNNSSHTGQITMENGKKEDLRYEYQFDQRGNLVYQKDKHSPAEVLREFNARNLITREIYLLESSLILGIEYRYDVFGRLIFKSQSNGINYYYLRDKDGHLMHKIVKDINTGEEIDGIVYSPYLSEVDPDGFELIRYKDKEELFIRDFEGNKRYVIDIYDVLRSSVAYQQRDVLSDGEYFPESEIVMSLIIEKQRLNKASGYQHFFRDVFDVSLDGTIGSAGGELQIMSAADGGYDGCCYRDLFCSAACSSCFGDCGGGGGGGGGGGSTSCYPSILGPSTLIVFEPGNYTLITGSCPSPENIGWTGGSGLDYGGGASYTTWWYAPGIFPVGAHFQASTSTSVWNEQTEQWEHLVIVTSYYAYKTVSVEEPPDDGGDGDGGGGGSSTPTIQITSVVSPSPGRSFISNRSRTGDRILLQASATANGQDISNLITWTYVGNEWGEFNTTTGASVVFVPRPNECPDGRSSALSYTIYAKISTDGGRAEDSVKLPAASRGASLAQLQSKLRRPLL